MCHGEQGDGKGEVVESMKLTMRDWHDPAALAGITDGEIFYIITKGKGKMMGGRRPAAGKTALEPGEPGAIDGGKGRASKNPQRLARIPSR